MFVVKNAWKSVTRNKGRNMLIIVIVTIIAAAATIGLSIRQAAATARSSGLDNTTVTAHQPRSRQTHFRIARAVQVGFRFVRCFRQT